MSSLPAAHSTVPIDSRSRARALVLFALRLPAQPVEVHRQAAVEQDLQFLGERLGAVFGRLGVEVPRGARPVGPRPGGQEPHDGARRRLAAERVALGGSGRRRARNGLGGGLQHPLRQRDGAERRHEDKGDRQHAGGAVHGMAPGAAGAGRGRLTLRRRQGSDRSGRSGRRGSRSTSEVPGTGPSTGAGTSRPSPGGRHRGAATGGCRWFRAP